MLVNLKSWMNEEDSLNVFINWNEMFKSGIPLGFNGELPSQKIHQSSWKCLTDCLILRYKDLTYQSYSTLDVLWKTSTAMYFHGNWSEESSKVLRVSTTIYYSVQFSRSVVSDSLWLHGLRHARLPCPSPIPRACSNLSIEPMMPFNHLVLCPPLLLLPSIFPSIGVFSSESVLHIRWPKY